MHSYINMHTDAQTHTHMPTHTKHIHMHACTKVHSPPLHVASVSSSPVEQSTLPSHIHCSRRQSVGFDGFPQNTW